MISTGGDTPLERWRADLAAWAIPQGILDQAAESPWRPERGVFVRRAATRRAAPRGGSYRRALEALPENGTVLDIGAGAGAASLPLLTRASALVAVDQDAQLLAELVPQAGADGSKIRTVVGAWPAVASSVGPADVVVCHHVLYNVPDLRPFIEALSAHARRRVVIEITERHPIARLNPLWERFHGLVRPTRPTWEDALAAIRSVEPGVQAERERLPADVPPGPWDELVDSTRRRLCLPEARAAEVAAALIESGALPADPATWSAPSRDVVTLWWDA